MGSTFSTGEDLTILISALALLFGSGSRNQLQGEEIFVRVDRSVSIERLATVVQPMGRIESREGDKTTYLIQLNPGIDDASAKKRLGKVQGVRALDADEEPVDMRSVRSLSRKIAHLSADENEERAVGNGKKAQHEKDKADYFKAYRYMVAQRAYPNDTFDWGTISRAREQVKSLEPTVIGWSGKGPKPAASQSWEYLGPTNLQVPYEQYYGVSPVNGRVNAVAYDPNVSTTIYAGGAQGGLWKSIDAGSTWSWLSSSWTQLAINCIVIDPTNTSTIYVARGDYHGFIAGSYGIMKSTDGGVTWNEIAISSMGQVGVCRLMMDPTNSQILVAGTGDANTYGQMFRSTDGGQTWKKISVGGSNFYWPAIASSLPTKTNVVRFYALAGGIATSTGAPSRLYKSDDHGVTWQLLPSPITTDGNFHNGYCVATSPTNSNNVYIFDSENQLLYSSTNLGSSWTNLSGNLPLGLQDYNFSQSFYDYHLECGPPIPGASSSDVLYLGEIDIAESLDGGNTWISLGGPSYNNNAISHNDQHCLAVCPTNPSQAIFSNDGGVYSLAFSNKVNKVTPMNQNLGNSMFYKIALHPTNPDYILGGTQDNASPFSNGDLANWLNFGGGDGGGSAINQTNPLIQYTSSEGMVIDQTPDGWKTENQIADGSFNFQGNLPFVASIALDPQNQYLMYTGSNYLYQWNEKLQTWNGPLGNQNLVNQAGNSTGPAVQGLAVAPTDSNRIYTGSSDGALWMSINQGSSWVHLNVSASALPNQAITSISVSPTNENDILIGLSGAGGGTGHLYRCTNTLATIPVFTNVSGSGGAKLPDVSLNAIARDLDNPGSTWWVAMDAGVFESSNSGASWTNAGAALGLPNVIVDDLVSVPGTRYLNAGTYGRGFWRLPLPVGFQIISLANFTVSPSSIEPGSATTGTVILSGPAPSGGITVNLTSSSTVVSVPASVTLPAGSTTATFTVQASGTVTTTSSSVVSATYGGVSMTQDVTVTLPSVSGVTASPNVVQGGTSVIGTVEISTAAGPNGVTVNLASNSASASVPPTVTVPSGANSATFTITTVGVASKVTAVLKASIGSSSASTSLIIATEAVQSMSLVPNAVVGGSQTPVTATVTLTGVAPSAGATVTVSSSNSGDATVPASIKVTGGTTTVTFNVSHRMVSTAGMTTIKATYGGVSQTATLTVNPFLISSFLISPSSVIGGTSVSGTISLNATAGAGSKAIAVKLKSTSSAAIMPTGITVPIGSSSTTFMMKTTAVKTTVNPTITASVGLKTLNASFTIQSPTLSWISVSPSTVQGSAKVTVTGTVTISSPAPVGGLAINLSSSTSSAASVPATVIIPAGKTTATFKVTQKKVTAQSSVILTGTLNGASQTTSLIVTP